MNKRFEIIKLSPGLQLLLLLGLVFLSIVLFQLIFSLLLMGFSSSNITNVVEITSLPRGWANLMVIFNQVGMFLCPAIIFSVLYQKDLPLKYFYATNKAPKMGLIMIFILFIPTAILSVDLFEFLNSELISWLPDSVNQSLESSREDSTEMLSYLLNDSSPAAVLLQFTAIALLPAVAEELLFRGVLMRLFYQFTFNIHVSIFTVALLFAALHFQFHYLIPMWFMGIMLGYAYYWTGSIIFPIILHLINNSLAIYGIHFYNGESEELMNILIMVFSLLLPLSIYLMSRFKNEHSLNTWYKY